VLHTCGSGDISRLVYRRRVYKGDAFACPFVRTPAPQRFLLAHPRIFVYVDHI